MPKKKKRVARTLAPQNVQPVKKDEPSAEESHVSQEQRRLAIKHKQEAQSKEENKIEDDWFELNGKKLVHKVLLENGRKKSRFVRILKPKDRPADKKIIEKLKKEGKLRQASF